MRDASRVLIVSMGLFFGVSSAAIACPGRQTVWDLPLGASVSDLPDAFGDYACGSNGGPPLRPLQGFDDYPRCEADERGFHEVYFRYDDEPEFAARALEQQRLIELCEGTRIDGIPVIASALFDDTGILRGIRIVSDARGAVPAERNDHWALGLMLRRQFAGDWACSPIPLGSGSTPVGDFLPNEECSLTADAVTMTVRQEYYHRVGQSFIDEFGDAQPGLFVSEAYFEMIQTDGAP
jgi:hypothetical protein